MNNATSITILQQILNNKLLVVNITLNIRGTTNINFLFINNNLLLIIIVKIL